MIDNLSRRARQSAWAWCLLVGGVLGCREPAPVEPSIPEAAREPTSAPGRLDAGATGLPEVPAPDASVRIRTAPRQPAGAPDAGPVRHQLQGVPRPGAEPQGTCPPDTHRCCDGSCSPHKGCPGIACDPGTPLSE